MSAANGYHEEEALGKAYDSRLMKRLLRYMKPYRGWALLAVVLLLLGSVGRLAMVKLTQVGIDEHITPGVLEGFDLIALVFFGLMIVSFIAAGVQYYLTQWLGQKVQYDIRMQIYRHLQSLHLGFFDKNPVGRILTRVTNDVNVLDEMFSSGVVTIIGDLVMVVLIVTYMLLENWRLALVSFVVLPLLVAATAIFRVKVRQVYREVRTRLARLNAFLQEHITGMSIVQLFVQEKRTFDRFDEINTDLRSAHQRSIIYYATFFPTVEVIGVLSVVLILYYGGLQVESDIMTLGQLVAFIQLVEMFYRPIRDLSDKYNVLQSSMASSERIFKLLDTPPQIEAPATPAETNGLSGRIDVENLWFAYNDEDWVLRDVTFSVAPKEKIAIVGATGAGKTSLISLLYRFYDFQKGSISFDGIDIRRWSIPKLRGHMALVLQDVFLFSGDYAGNVRLRDQSITDDEVRAALSRVGFDRFLERLPNGIQSEIRERGATLSTGQKQLLSFARALAFDPEILILDEATSSVDTETELLIQRALDELLKDRTSIIIAHRLSTIERADKILVFHHGQLRESGRHDELLKQRGIYYKLYQMQFKQERGAGPSIVSEQPTSKSV
ncbi:MAG: ABC transporter ATP-binding protein [candidate division Zixibacteria bacterium]|jgi:ATP-binding cassette subfamily B protein|nr:ABC transporter ATP-binding protein [candidate division Zixibacteria bacterium]